MKKINKYSAKLFTKLLIGIASFEQTADQEILHGIRINIKKIRSLFRLIRYCDNNFKDKKQFRPLRIIFSKAGVIRNIFVSGKLIEEFDLNTIDNSINLRSDNENRLEFISTFIKDTNRNSEIVYKKYFDLEKHIANVSRECFEKYFIIKKKELMNFIYPLLIEAKLHNARRICKEITFLNEINNKSKKSIDPFFDKLQDLIGQWHDKIDLLKIVINKGMDTSDIFRKKLEKEIMSDLISIKELVNDYYKTN